jgi:hypothetical protein
MTAPPVLGDSSRSDEYPLMIVRDEYVTTRVVVSVGPVDGRSLGTFGWFIGVRRRDKAKEVADRRRFGACVICRHGFSDDDLIHMVFSVVRNGKTIGNRLCCPSCAEQHATYHHSPGASLAGGS